MNKYSTCSSLTDCSEKGKVDDVCIKRTLKKVTYPSDTYYRNIVLKKDKALNTTFQDKSQYYCMPNRSASILTKFYDMIEDPIGVTADYSVVPYVNVSDIVDVLKPNATITNFVDNYLRMDVLPSCSYYDTNCSSDVYDSNNRSIYYGYGNSTCVGRLLIDLNPFDPNYL